MRKYIKSIEGFSLIELSIIITVFAVLLTSLLAGSRINVESENVISVEKKMFEVEKALAFFQKANGYLPCPASRIVGYDNANYGVSVDCSSATATAAPAGTVNIDNGTGAADTYQVRVGAIPTRTLGLPDAAALDAFGNRLSYMIIRSLGVDSATYTGFSSAQPTDLFQVVDKVGAPIYGGSNAQIIKYVVLSHGADGKGAFNKNGVRALACPTIPKDSENCDDDKLVMQGAINDTVATSNVAYYNDYVRYKAK